MRIRLLKILDATAGALLCWLGGWALHLSRSRTDGGPRASLSGLAVRRILVIRPGGMGDMILLQPMLKVLRRTYPGAFIDLVCERRNRDIPELAGASVETLLYDIQPLRTIRLLLRRRYDLAIDTEQFHNFSAVMAWVSGAPVRIGFKINPGRNPIYTHLVNYDLEGYEAGEFMRLLAPLGIHEKAVVEGCLAVDVRSTPSPGPLAGVRSGLILLHIGTSTRYKRWEMEKTGALVKQLITGPLAGISNPVVGLVGGRKDAGLARRIAALADQGDRVRIMAGELPLRETAALIAKSTLFIGGDSGLAHMAVALGTPTVVLFGPSDPLKWGVSSPHNAVVCKDLACAPCFIFGYHKRCHTIACMAGITVDEVVSACSKVSASATAAGQSR